MLVSFTDTDQRSQNLCHLYPSMELQLGEFGFKITMIRQLRMYCGLRVKVNTCEMCTACEDHGRISFAFVSAWLVARNLNTPNWSYIADNTITQAGIGVLVSSFYICGSFAKINKNCWDVNVLHNINICGN